MNASASDRHRLFVHLEQLLGPEDAATLMEHLPPTEWGELATKADLREMERRLVEHVDLRVKATVGESSRLLFFSMLASQATLVGMVLAATKLG
jgi:hypothetical protein